MALDLYQNFVSTQYFENKLTEFDQILENGGFGYLFGTVHHHKHPTSENLK